MDVSKGSQIVSSVATVTAALGILFLAWVGWNGLKETKAGLSGHTAALDSIRKQLEKSSASTWVGANDTVNNCYADNSSVTCTVTNMRGEAITTCLRGKLAQKKATGVALSSLVICTGRLGPRETKSTAAPWVGGFARDICHSTDRWGNEVLDWEACTFTTEPVDVAAPEKALAARPEK